MKPVFQTRCDQTLNQRKLGQLKPRLGVRIWVKVSVRLGRGTQPDTIFSGAREFVGANNILEGAAYISMPIVKRQLQKQCLLHLGAKHKFVGGEFAPSLPWLRAWLGLRYGQVLFRFCWSRQCPVLSGNQEVYTRLLTIAQRLILCGFCACTQIKILLTSNAPLLQTRCDQTLLDIFLTRIMLSVCQMPSSVLWMFCGLAEHSQCLLSDREFVFQTQQQTCFE